MLPQEKFWNDWNLKFPPVLSAASEAIWSNWTELPEMTTSHIDVGASPAGLVPLFRRYKYI